MKIKISLLILGYLFILACNNSLKQYAIFDYEDFGPQAMAWEKIGMQWWQWDNHGDSDPDSKYDIKVVIYKGIQLGQIKKLFPLDKSQNKDFRYLEYHDSMKYLNDKIEELSHEKEEWAINLRRHLVDTKDRIQHEIKQEN